MILALYEHPRGVATEPGNRVVYDIERNAAFFGAARVGGQALRFELGEEVEPGAKLAQEVRLEGGGDWVVRCDRVDFPPGGRAYLHTHTGPGIRCLLRGSIRIES